MTVANTAVPLLDPPSAATAGLDAALLMSIGIGAIGLLLGGLAVRSLVRRDRVGHGPLCRHLKRRLHLSGRDRRLLDRVADAVNVPSMAALVVSRGCFDHAACHFVRRHGQAARLAEIRVALFEEEADG